MEKITLGVIIFAFAAWAAKEIYSSVKDETRKNTEVTQTNTLAVLELKLKLESFSSALDRFHFAVAKLEKDVNEIHKKLRKDA